MYIDDSVILACGDSWRKVEKVMKTGYTTCLDWLRRAGLSAEPAKTELIFFRKRGEKTNPPHSVLETGSQNSLACMAVDRGKF